MSKPERVIGVEQSLQVGLVETGHVSALKGRAKHTSRVKKPLIVEVVGPVSDAIKGEGERKARACVVPQLDQIGLGELERGGKLKCQLKYTVQEEKKCGTHHLRAVANVV